MLSLSYLREAHEIDLLPIATNEDINLGNLPKRTQRERVEPRVQIPISLTPGTTSFICFQEG